MSVLIRSRLARYGCEKEENERKSIFGVRSARDTSMRMESVALFSVMLPVEKKDAWIDVGIVSSVFQN